MFNIIYIKGNEMSFINSFVLIGVFSYLFTVIFGHVLGNILQWGIQGHLTGAFMGILISWKLFNKPQDEE